MAFTSGGKKLGVTLLLAAVLGGGYFFVNKHKASIKIPATTQEGSKLDIPVVEEKKEVVTPVSTGTTTVSEPVTEVAPVKKHTAGHVAKHVPAKHQTHTKSTPQHSSSTPTHSTETAEHKAMRELVNE